MKRFTIAAWRSLSVVSVVFAAAFSTGFATASTVAWSGSGATGTDPFGQTWRLQNDGWGIPGPGQGNIPWSGPQNLTKFEIQFTGLPAGTIIDSIPDVSGTVFRLTPFSPGASDWNRQLGTTSVSFSAPISSPGPLAPGRNFFVNIGFDGAFNIPSVGFNAVYTLVPEPSTFFAAVLAALVCIGCRRRSSGCRRTPTF